MTLAVRHGNTQRHGHGIGYGHWTQTQTQAQAHKTQALGSSASLVSSTAATSTSTSSSSYSSNPSSTASSSSSFTPYSNPSSAKHRQLLNGRYSVIGDLNQGSYGKVCLVKDIASHNQLKAVKCIKAIKRERRKDKDYRARAGNDTKERDDDLKVSTAAEVETEIRIHKQLGNHTNVAKLLDHFETNDTRYLVMEYYSGGDLYEAIKANRGPKEQGNIYSFMSQLISAVEHCHSRGIYHRDIKPENILLAGNGTVKLSDWGLSTTKRWNTEFGVGSERYMAPELFDEVNTKRYDASKVDIWALGICLLNILFGKNPFTVACHKDKLFMDFSASRESLFDIFPTLSPDVFAVLRHCLTIDPDNRSLKGMKDELQKVEMWTTDDFDYLAVEQESMESDRASANNTSVNAPITTATTAPITATTTSSNNMATTAATATALVTESGPSSIPDFVCTNDRKPFRVPSVMNGTDAVGTNNSMSFRDWNRTSLFTPPVHSDGLAARKGQHHGSFGNSFGHSYGHSYGNSYGSNLGHSHGHSHGHSGDGFGGHHYGPPHGAGHSSIGRGPSIYETDEGNEEQDNSLGEPEEDLSNDELSFETSRDDHDDDVFAMDQDNVSSQLNSMRQPASSAAAKRNSRVPRVPRININSGGGGGGTTSSGDRNSSDSSISSVPSLVPNNYKSTLIDAAINSRVIPIERGATRPAALSKGIVQSVGAASGRENLRGANTSSKAALCDISTGGRSVPTKGSSSDFWKFNKNWGDFDFDDDDDSEADEFYEMLAASLPKSKAINPVDSNSASDSAGTNSSVLTADAATSSNLTAELAGKFEDIHISVASSSASGRDSDSWLMTSQWAR